MRALRTLGSLVRHAFWFEVSIYVALWRWASRRPDVPRGATAIPYGQLVGPMLWLFIAGSAVEVVAIDLVLHHVGWTAVRLPLLVVGIWSLVWMVGLLAAIRTRPHVLTDDELVLRAGLRGSVPVPLRRVTAAVTREHDLSSSMRSIEVQDDRLLVGVSGRTNLLLPLVGPTELATPKGDVTVTSVGIWVDEPRQVAAALRARTPAVSREE